MAPEVMQFQEFNEKCDVYSFGIGMYLFIYFIILFIFYYYLIINNYFIFIY